MVKTSAGQGAAADSAEKAEFYRLVTNVGVEAGLLLHGDVVVGADLFSEVAGYAAVLAHAFGETDQEVGARAFAHTAQLVRAVGGEAEAPALAALRSQLAGAAAQVRGVLAENQDVESFPEALAFVSANLLENAFGDELPQILNDISLTLAGMELPLDGADFDADSFTDADVSAEEIAAALAILNPHRSVGGGLSAEDSSGGEGETGVASSEFSCDAKAEEQEFRSAFNVDFANLDDFEDFDDFAVSGGSGSYSAGDGSSSGGGGADSGFGGNTSDTYYDDGVYDDRFADEDEDDWDEDWD
ncbi:MAG: hypothetical protein Q4A71_04185 [Actinomycetaceae bacterium]|nr:hypothetical protein [Actinomycetaceae bacterium]